MMLLVIVIVVLCGCALRPVLRDLFSDHRLCVLHLRVCPHDGHLALSRLGVHHFAVRYADLDLCRLLQASQGLATLAKDGADILVRDGHNDCGASAEQGALPDGCLHRPDQALALSQLQRGLQVSSVLGVHGELHTRNGRGGEPSDAANAGSSAHTHTHTHRRTHTHT
jgi:hypothetical protein